MGRSHYTVSPLLPFPSCPLPSCPHLICLSTGQLKKCAPRSFSFSPPFSHLVWYPPGALIQIYIPTCSLRSGLGVCGHTQTDDTRRHICAPPKRTQTWLESADLMDCRSVEQRVGSWICLSLFPLCLCLVSQPSCLLRCINLGLCVSLCVCVQPRLRTHRTLASICNKSLFIICCWEVIWLCISLPPPPHLPALCGDVIWYYERMWPTDP